MPEAAVGCSGSCGWQRRGGGGASHGLGDQELADARTQHGTAVATTAERGWPGAFHLHLPPRTVHHDLCSTSVHHPAAGGGGRCHSRWMPTAWCAWMHARWQGDRCDTTTGGPGPCQPWVDAPAEAQHSPPPYRGARGAEREMQRFHAAAGTAPPCGVAVSPWAAARTSPSEMARPSP